MLKKVFVTVLALIFVLPLSVFALEVGDEFFVLGKDNKEIAGILNLDKKLLTDYCEENFITFLALNRENTKQIRETQITTDFSTAIGNLSLLSDEEISQLMPDIIGVENISGRIVTRKVFKYVYCKMKGTDSGGEYILTQYITVSEGKLVTLSFYTDSNTDDSYVAEIFESQFSKPIISTKLVAVFIIVFAAIAVCITVSVIRDFKKSKTQSDDQENKIT